MSGKSGLRSMVDHPQPVIQEDNDEVEPDESRIAPASACLTQYLKATPLGANWSVLNPASSR
jgi:hypothetical protein